MTEPITSPGSSKVLRASVWVAIGALIAAAIVCVIWVLIGDSNGIVGKAFMTVVLLAGFAGVSIGESNLAPRRPAWLALASIVTWVIALLVGAFLIWMPGYLSYGFERFFKFVLIVLILQGALLHVRLFLKAHQRYQVAFTSVVTYVTLALVVILAVMLIVPTLTEEYVYYRPIYWRVVVALAILAAVGTALVPLVNALFAPKRPRPETPAGHTPASYTQPALERRYAEYTPSAPQQPYAPPAGHDPVSAPQWPTYADGVTPLPALPDGAPDWNAYYTGHPSFPPPPAEQAAPPAQPGYEGYPPPPPVPPQR